MKRWLSLSLALLLFSGLWGGALAAPFGPLPVRYGDNAMDVTVREAVFGGEEGARVTLAVPEGQYLLYITAGGVEMGMALVENITQAANDGSTPFYTGVDVWLELNGRFLEPQRVEATKAEVSFYFDTREMPEYVCIAPRGEEPLDGVFISAEELDGAYSAPQGAPDAGADAGESTDVVLSAPDIRFTIDGVEYFILALQDVPEEPMQNLLNDREGHAILFGYTSSQTSDGANASLYRGVALILPDGEKIGTYANNGNSRNPYTLYFGLPEGISLADCVLRVAADDGQVEAPLGGEAHPAGDAPAQAAADSAQDPPLTMAPTEEAYVAQILLALAEEATDPWQKAIYGAGVQGVRTEDGVTFFFLRSFNPRARSLGEYNEETAEAWFAGMMENVTAYDLEASLALENGEATADSLKALQRAVRNGAEAAQTDFNLKNVRLAIAGLLLPLPYAKLSSLEELDTQMPSGGYRALAGEIPAMEDAGEDAYAPLLYAQVSQSLSVKEGPFALVLNCRGANPAQMMDDAYAAALQTLSMRYKANDMSQHEIRRSLLEALITEANAIRRREGEKFTLTLSVEDLAGGYCGAEYESYLAGYDFEETLDALCQAVWAMPDAAAQEFPRTGYISGSNAGTKVIFKTPDDGLGRYVQVRSVATDEEALALFIRPGGSATVYIRQGMYYLMIASGEVWYGEEGLFGESGSYSRSTDTQIDNADYYHTITLQAVEKGNMSTYGADMDDFFNGR